MSATSFFTSLVNPTWLLQNVLQKALLLVHHFDHIAIFIASFKVLPLVIYHKQRVSIRGLPWPVPISVLPLYHLMFTVHTESFLQFSLTLAFSNQLLISILMSIVCILLTYSLLLEGLLHKRPQRSFFKCLFNIFLP